MFNYWLLVPTAPANHFSSSVRLYQILTIRRAKFQIQLNLDAEPNGKGHCSVVPISGAALKAYCETDSEWGLGL